MIAIIPTKLKQVQSEPKKCGGEIFHKYLVPITDKKNLPGQMLPRYIQKVFSTNWRIGLYEQPIKYFSEDNAFPRASYEQQNSR